MNKSALMIPFDEAYGIVMSSSRQLGAERVSINCALRRILAEDVKSDMDMPPFDKSAMDGYACRRQDLSNELTVVETIQAGAATSATITRNQCAKIMTGAMVPPGADCVVMLEMTEQPTADTIRLTSGETPDNICYRGEDIKEGEIVLRKGEKITCRHLAVLASVGRVEPCVALRPKVGIIATGNELVEPSVVPGKSQIRNSNSCQLCAQIDSVGGITSYYGIAQDRKEDIDRLLERATSENDAIVISGGVSMGEFDFVPDVLRKNKIRLLFDKVAIKPGMPTVFGSSDDVFFFGLPGNPVSTFVVFELLMKPFLYRMTGHDFKPPVVAMRLEKGISRKTTERASWLPVAIGGTGKVVPVEYHGSGHIGALPGADGLICLPAGVAELPKGSVVDVRQI